jgi:hypothetical protein
MFQNRLELRMSGDISDHWMAAVEGRFEHWLWGEGSEEGANLLFNSTNVQGSFEACLRDAFLSGRYGGFYLTVGNQSIVWGAGTLTQPAAVINPVDYRYGVFGNPADYRIPVLAVDATIVVDRFSFSTVVAPIFEPDLFSIYGTDFSLISEARPPMAFTSSLEQLVPHFDPSMEPFLQEVVTVTEWPSPVPKNMSAGARMTSTYGGVDLGLGYYFGWDRLPFATIEVDETVQPPDPSAYTFTSTYRRLHTLEADMVVFLGPIGFRAEVVFHPEKTAYLEHKDPAIRELVPPEATRLPTLHSALSLYYELSQSFVIQVEGVLRHTFDVPEEMEPVHHGEEYFAFAFMFSFGLDAIDAIQGTVMEALSFLFAGVLGMTNEEYAVYPSATWSFSDAIDLTLGAMFFGGPPLEERITVGGLFDDNDQVYISFTWRF